ncbi:MAG: RHS repeat protein, partial [Candidatus Omnitrophica bacterium]|nr:RHS repeat protein [Candidatus Omnitrophota bacterium]
RFTFDAAGHITRKELFTDGTPPDKPKSYVTLYEYNAAGERTRVVFPRGNSIESAYDAKGNLLEQRRKKIGAAKGVPDPSDLVTTFTYESRFNLLKTLTDPRGNVTTYAYDDELGEESKGNLRRITGPAVDGISPVTTFTSNGFGQVDTVTDPTGVVTKDAYDPATGYLLSTTDGWGTPLAGTTRFTHDEVGNVTATIDPNGHRTNFVYNVLNQLVQRTAPAPFGFETFYIYEANGNLFRVDQQTTTTRPGPRPRLNDGPASPTDDWQTTRYGYTTLDQLASVADDLTQTTGFGYDGSGNRTTLTDAKNQKTTSLYDERNLPATVTDAATPAGITASRYDPNGNLTEIKDAKGNPTTYLYDDFDRLSKTTYADGSFEGYGYDKNGNLTSRVTPAGQRITYEYNARDLLTKTITPEDTTIFTYDLAGRLLTATNSTGTITLTYDTRGRVKTVTSPGGKPLTSAYDAAGNRTQLSHPDGFTVLAHYDALHRLIRVSTTASPVPGFVTPTSRNGRLVLTWQGQGALQVAERVTGPWRDVTPPPTSPYEVPLAGAMQFYRLLASPGSAPTHAPISFLYDALSRRTGLTWPTGLTTTYGYDAANRLLSLMLTRGTTARLSLGATYDPLGNRLTQQSEAATAPLRYAATYAYDAVSQLLSATVNGVKTDFRYDAVGNRLAAAGQLYVPNRLNQYTAVGATTLRHDLNGNLTFDGVRTYAYDSQSHLISVTAPRLNASYAYDPLGRRISKTVNGLTTQFLFDGDQLIADYDASGKLLARYIYGAGLDEPLMMVRGDTTYSFHADALGSILALTDSRGQVIESYRYDAFGTPTILDPSGQVRATSLVGNRFLFTGREYDSETGLYYFRQRYYHPGFGRFVSREPDPTDPNPYRYVNNNPTSWIDPLGTKLLSPPPTQGLMPGIEGTGGISPRAPPISIDVSPPSPPSPTEWQPPIANPPSGPDVLPIPPVGTEAGQRGGSKWVKAQESLGILTAKGSNSGDEKRPKKGGQKGKGKDIKQVDDIARQFGMDERRRSDFGRFIEKTKGGQDLTFQDLIKAAKEFLER